MGMDSSGGQILGINLFGEKNRRRKKLKFGRKMCKLRLFFLLLSQWMTLAATQSPFIYGQYYYYYSFSLLYYLTLFPDVLLPVFCC